MIPNDAATRAVTLNGTDLQRGRGSLIAVRLTQGALAVTFLMAGGSKLAGVPVMVSLFDQVGVGQWFRYVTGIIELTAGIALLIPSAGIFGAMLLIPTMLGAIVINVFVVPASPVPPLVLCSWRQPSRGPVAISFESSDPMHLLFRRTVI